MGYGGWEMGNDGAQIFQSICVHKCQVNVEKYSKMSENVEK